MIDRSEWTDLDYEIESDWLASLTPWQYVAYLGAIGEDGRAAAREYASSATGCATIEVDGVRLTVRAPYLHPHDRGELWFTPDGVNVPVFGPIGSVFVPVPREH